MDTRTIGELTSRRSSVLLMTLVVFLLVSNGLLLSKNTRLQSELAATERSREPVVGALAADLDGTDVDGKPLLVRFARAAESRKTLLLVLSPTCPFCEKNWPSWKEIRESAVSHDTRVVYVDVSSRLDHAYLSHNGLAHETVLTGLSLHTAQEHRFGATPQTILISGKGVVERVWTGLLGQSDVRDIMRRL